MNGMASIHFALVLLAAFLPLALPGQDVSKGEAPGFYEVEGIRIPVHVVTVREEGEETPSAKGNTPPSKGSVYFFQTIAGEYKANYSRYLNRTPEWQGKHGASVGFDMGLGFSGLGTNWYGNTLRVRVDGDDVIARLAADKIEYKTGPGMGRWRGLWTTAKGSLTINLAVIDGVGAGLLEIAFDGPATAIELDLNCFPGGYGPAYGTPSIRAAQAGQETVQVGTGEENKTLTVPAGADSIFYCDRWPETQKLAGSGSCGLVFIGDQIAAATVLVSNYGVCTTLKLPPGTKTADLALTEYPLPNATAAATLAHEQAQLRDLLKSTEFWTKEK